MPEVHNTRRLRHHFYCFNCVSNLTVALRCFGADTRWTEIRKQSYLRGYREVLFSLFFQRISRSMNISRIKAMNLTRNFPRDFGFRTNQRPRLCATNYNSNALEFPREGIIVGGVVGRLPGEAQLSVPSLSRNDVKDFRCRCREFTW